MIRRAVIALAFLPAVAMAQPVPCQVGDYQQYKDKAASDLPDLARMYCVATVIEDYNGYKGAMRDLNACIGEKQKMRDAAAAAGKAQEFARMADEGSCRERAAKGLRPR